MENTKLLNTPQAADLLKLGVATLEKLRCVGGGPRFYKIGKGRQ